jgi:hypothetical protein
MASEGDRKALDAMRKKLDEMMQADELLALNESRKKVLIAPSEAVLLEEQVQEKAQLANELALARERRRLEASSTRQGGVKAPSQRPKHTPEVLAMLREISELELAGQPPPTANAGTLLTSSVLGKEDVARRRSTSPQAQTAKHCAERGTKKRSATVSRQATELEAARTAARAAEEAERKFMQMRLELRNEVLEEVFGFASEAPSTCTVNAPQIDVIGELDFCQAQHEILSTAGVSLEDLVEHYRSSSIWGELCSRTSPVLALDTAPAAYASKGKMIAPAKKVNRRALETTINYDEMDENAPIPKARVPDVVLPPREPIPRDEMLSGLLEELDMLHDDNEKAEASLLSRSASFRHLSEAANTLRASDRPSSSPPAASSDNRSASAPHQSCATLPLFEAPRAFAEPAAPVAAVAPPPPVTDEAASSEVVLSSLRSRAKRNLQHITHLRSLAAQ